MRERFHQKVTRLGHPSDEALSRLINGELSSIRTFSVNAHLANCWQCRSRRETLEKVALQVVEYRKYSLQPRLPLDPRRRDVFLDNLDQVLEEIATAPWHARLLSRISSIPVAVMNPVYASTLVIVTAVVLLVLIWQHNAPTVSAKVLLEEAVQAEARQANPAGVIYQKIKIKANSRTIVRSLYRDPAHHRLPRVAALQPDEAVVRDQLNTAGVNWQQPLSADDFRQWHDQLADKTDSVETQDPNVLTLVTKTNSTSVKESSLSLRKTDFHPVSRQILLRDSGEIEISETNYDVLSWDAVNAASLFEPIPAPVPVRPSLDQPIPNLRETEIAARYALHRLGADLGEPIEVHPDVQGAVDVSGIVESPERKHELIASLKGIPHVNAQIQTEDEAGARELHAPVTRAAPKIVTVRSPIEKELLEHFGDPSAVDDFSKKTIAVTDDLMAHAWALRHLSEQFPPTGTKGELALNSSARLSLETMRRDHRRAMSGETAQLAGMLNPVLQTIAQAPPESARRPALFANAQQVQVLILELVSGTSPNNTNENVEPAKAAQDLLAALRGLQTALEE
jgi:hypothetical protein